MPTAEKHLPPGYHSITPVLVIKDVAVAIKFYKEAFGAKETLRPHLMGPKGKIAHAELSIGDSLIVLGDEFPQWGDLPPQTDTHVRIGIHVEDAEAVSKNAVAAGAKLLIPVAEQYYGEKSGRVVDPFGYVWIISTHLKDVPPQEIARIEAHLATQPDADWIAV